MAVTLSLGRQKAAVKAPMGSDEALISPMTKAVSNIDSNKTPPFSTIGPNGPLVSIEKLFCRTDHLLRLLQGTE